MEKKNSFKCKLLIEIIANIIILVIIAGLLWGVNPWMKTVLSLAYVKDAIKSINSFLEMSIGIYIAVISILATARTSITEKLSKEKKHEIFIITISIGFVETVLALIFSNIFLGIDYFSNSFIIPIIISLVIISILQISRFFFALLIMFNITVSSAASEARAEQEKHKDIMLKLNKIQNRLDDIIKKLN
jgi:hypothetical protein